MKPGTMLYCWIARFPRLAFRASVYPISDGATKQLAKHYAGALRAIQNQSNAPRTYIKALESAMASCLVAPSEIG